MPYWKATLVEIRDRISGSDAKALKIHKGPLQGIGELLEELLIGDTFLAGEKFQHGIL